MKAGHNAIYMLVTIILCLCFGVSGTRAQDIIDIKGRIKVVNKIAGENNTVRVDTMPQIVYYGVFGDMAKAKKAKADLDKFRYSELNNEGFRDKCREIGFGRQTKGNGSFSTRALPGMVILAVTKYGDVSLDKEGNIPTAYVISGGKSYYNIEIETHNLIGGGTSGKKRIVIGEPPTDTGDGTVNFPINFLIPKDSVKKTTRIVVQPYAIDCMNEDTMSYLIPLVFEGDYYHELQDKRRAFDYFKNDTLANNYYSALITGFQDIDPEKTTGAKLSSRYVMMDSLRNKKKVDVKKDSVMIAAPVVFDLDSLGLNYQGSTVIKYRLPQKDRMCHGAYVVALENLHRVYSKKSYPGTCLVNRPFKFLDFSAGIPEMELTTDYQEPAEENFAKVNDKLDLRFVQGRAELEKDSVNEMEAARMAEILGNQEGLLSQTVTITATSSPEGGDKINKDLAAKRAVVARQYLSRLLRGVTPKTETKLYTWDEVADRLAADGKRVEAQTVRDVIAANGTNKPALDRAMRDLEFYAPLIDPILKSMRVMSYSYMFEKKHIMTETEVVQSYYSNKHGYLAGKSKLSSGDFYNLYSNISDSLELDTITMMAYEHLKLAEKRNNLSALYSERIAPYVLNRMARRLLDNGTPDTLMLAPFIDEPVSDTIFDKELNRKKQMLDVPDVCINNQDILITQAMNYYQLQMFPRAHKYIQWIKAMWRGSKLPDALNKIQMYMDLMTYYPSQQEDPRFIAAKNYVLNSSPDNKAILYTEIPDWRISFEDTNNQLDMMADDNPKKWYLKGMLWASKAIELDGDPDLSSYYPEEEPGFRILTDAEEEDLALKPGTAYDEYMKRKAEYLETHKDDPVKEPKEPVNIDGVKHYLAYFHHCFKLGGSSFKSLYYNEGRVSEDLRKKYLYLKKDFPAYDELFTLLKARDDENRAEQLGENEEQVDDAELLKEARKVDDSNAEAPTSEENSTSAPENKEEETKE